MSVRGPSAISPLACESCDLSDLQNAFDGAAVMMTDSMQGPLSVTLYTRPHALPQAPAAPTRLHTRLHTSALPQHVCCAWRRRAVAEKHAKEEAEDAIEGPAVTDR